MQFPPLMEDTIGLPENHYQSSIAHPTCVGKSDVQPPGMWSTSTLRVETSLLSSYTGLYTYHGTILGSPQGGCCECTIVEMWVNGQLTSDKVVIWFWKGGMALEGTHYHPCGQYKNQFGMHWSGHFLSLYIKLCKTSLDELKLIKNRNNQQALPSCSIC